MENISNPQEQMNLRIDPSTLDDVTCDRCKDRKFEPIYLVKRVSALQSPNGQAGVIPIGPIFCCYSCGHINDEFAPFDKREQEPSTPKLIVEE